MSKMATEKRLIDVNAIPESATTISTDGRLFVAWSEIVKAPTVDAVEVVRCRDCKYSYCNKYCTNEQWKDNGTTVTIEADDFCSYGERKDNG